MKAKVIKTGEVVEVHNTTTGWASDNLNLTRFFKESDLDFDYCEWEDFRRESAKMAMGQLIGMGRDDGYKYSPEEVAHYAIIYADELIKQLKEEKK